MGSAAYDVASAGKYGKARLQVGGADSPATQTSDAYRQEDSWDGTDELPFQYQTVENLGTGSSTTITFDMSKEGSASANRVAEDRSLFAVSLFLKDVSISLSEKLGIDYDVNVKQTTIKLSERLGISSNIDSKFGTIILSEKLGIDSDSVLIAGKLVTLTEKLGIDSDSDLMLDVKKLSEKLGITSTLFTQKDVKLSEKLGFTSDVTADVLRTPIDHTYVEITSLQETSSTSYVDIPGTIIPSSSFTVGDRYLLVMTGLVNGSDIAGDFGIITVVDSTPFDGSEMVFDPHDTTTESFVTYTWFTVWEAESGEDIKLQYRTLNGGHTVQADQITMFAMNLDEDLSENVDWFFENVTATTDLTTSLTTINNAAINVTPKTAGNDWLVMTSSQIDPTTVNNRSFISQIERTGEASSSTPRFRIEGEDATNDRQVQTNLRVFNLGSEPNTFTEVSEADGSGTLHGTRESSSVFALNLNVFKNVESVYTNEQINLDTTPTFTEVQTLTIEPDFTGNVWIMGSAAFDVQSSAGVYAKARLQVNDTDQPPTQTTDSYEQEDSWDGTDELPLQFQTVEKLSAFTYKIDIDASEETNASGRSAEDRSLFAVSLILNQRKVRLAENIGIGSDADTTIATKRLSEKLGINSNVDTQFDKKILFEKLGIGSDQATFLNKLILSEKLGISSNVDTKFVKLILSEKLGIDSDVRAQQSKVALSEKLGITDPDLTLKGGAKIEARDESESLIAGATYSVVSTDGSFTPLTVVDGGLNDNDSIPGRVTFSPLPFGSYNFTMTSIPATYDVLGNWTLHEVHNTHPNGTTTFRVVLQSIDLSTLPPTVITDSPSLNSTTYDTWTTTFDATIINGTEPNEIIDAVNELPPIVSVGNETSSSTIDDAIEKQATVELTPSTTLTAGLDGSVIIDSFGMPNYTMPESSELTAVLPGIVTLPSTGPQYIATPPLNEIVPGQDIILPIETNSIPSTGGVSQLEFGANETSSPVGTPSDEWLVIEVDDEIPAGFPENQLDELVLFVDIKYSFEEEGFGTDWSDPTTFDTNPILTLQTPLAENDDLILEGTETCADIEVFFFDGVAWTSVTNDIVSVEVTELALFCEVEVELEHFSSYHVAKRKVSASSTAPSAPSGTSGGGGAVGGGPSGGVGGPAGAPGFAGVIGPPAPGTGGGATFSDVTTRIADGQPIDAANPGGSCVDTHQRMIVSAIVDSQTPLKRAELRFAQYGQPDTEYTAIRMHITNMTSGPTHYGVEGSIPWDLMYGSPALKYWIHVIDENVLVSDSDQYLISTNPGYSISGNLEVDVTTIKVAGAKLNPIAYLTNTLDKAVAGAISLIVDGKVVDTSKPYVFEPGQTSVPLEWNIPKISGVYEYEIHAMGEFCGAILETDDVSLYTYPKTITKPITDVVNVELQTDEDGNVIAEARSLYSSNTDIDTNFRVVSPDGTCVIGSSPECLVSESTFGKRGNMESVSMGEQIYRIRYSGPDNALERFTITSVDPIIGDWKIYKESTDGIIPEAYAEEGSIKIKYRTAKIEVDTGISPTIEPPVRETIEFGGVIGESGISIFDVKSIITDETVHDLLSVMVHLSATNIVSAAETYNKTISNEPLKVSAIVEKPLEFTRAELRIVSSDESIDDYHSILMEVSDLEGNPAYAVISTTVPMELLSVGPEVTYWINLMGETSEESEKFTINVIADPQQETIEFGGIIEDTISKVPLKIELVETFTLAINSKENLKEIAQTIYVPQTVENYQNLIWILMIIFLAGLVFGLRRFGGSSPLIIRMQPNSLLVERTIQGNRQFISLRN